MHSATSSADEHIEEAASKSRRRHRRRLIIGGGLAVVVAVAAFVFLYFEPQKLFIDDHVNEPFPVAAPATSTAASPAPAAPTKVQSAPAAASAPDSPTSAPSLPSTTLPAGPVSERAGSFVSREHGTSGTATIYRFDDGRRVLRIEDLHTSNGPALFVYLSANPAAGPEGAFDDTYVDLGGLKGNIGDQNYEIPPEVNLADYTSVVIWCDRFDAAFGAADLT
jgi:hypothetical protein